MVREHLWVKIPDQTQYPAMMARLLTAPGPLSFVEAVKLFELAAVCAGSMLEIGSRAGRSTVALACGLHGNTLTCVDPFVHNWDDKEEDRRNSVVVPTAAQYEGTTEDCFRANLAPEIETGAVSVRRGCCETVLPGLHAAGREFELVFLDALHDYESVKSDLTNISAFRPPVLALHDYAAPWHPGVKQAADELGLGAPTAIADTIAVFYPSWDDVPG